MHAGVRCLMKTYITKQISPFTAAFKGKKVENDNIRDEWILSRVTASTTGT